MSAQQEGPHTPFEVYCHRCHVTFALGTKRCIHCGGRLGQERLPPGIELPPGVGDLELEQGVGRRSGLSPFTLVWVALLLVGYLYRACTT